MIIKTLEHPDELDIYMNEYKYIIIQVSADWCKPCKSISPLVNEYIKTLLYENILFFKCDFDIISEFDSFIETYDIQKIPYFIFLEYGVMKSSYKGADFDKVRSSIQEFVSKNGKISEDAFSRDDF